MDFIGAPRNSGTLTITGKVTTTEGTGLAGVLIATNDEQTATTDSNGNYTLRGLVEGNYTLTPTLAGYIFDPINRTVSVRHDTEGVNFIATPASTQLNMNLAVSALITVTVVDEDGAALANEPVDFSTDYGTVLPASTMTDEQGGATVVVVAEDTPGTATVTMTVDGMSESMSVRFGEITDIPAIYLPLIER
jgi:hypothetical protein